MEALNNTSPNATLYDAYCEFTRDAALATSSIFENKAVRQAILDGSTPMSEEEFASIIERMSPENRSRYVRRITLGFRLATLTASRGDISRIVNHVLRDGDVDLRTPTQDGIESFD